MVRCIRRIGRSIMPDFRRYVIDTVIFTPKTIRRFTSHDNGAV